jgi:hypothetical protein
MALEVLLGPPLNSDLGVVVERHILPLKIAVVLALSAPCSLAGVVQGEGL